MDVMTGAASGKKLESTSEDNVFVFFSDHGAPGLIAFPGSAGTLHKKELQSTFQTMSDKKMFNKLTFYLETCESGSMFEDMNIPGIYALSASNPTQSSWGSYCGTEAKVNGKSINSCLGDLFSVSWMEDADAVDTTVESLEQNFQTVKTATTRSEVMQWGDTTYTDDKMAEFIGNLNPSLTASASQERKGKVNVRQIDLQRLYDMYTAATTSAERLQVGQELQQQLQMQLAVDQIHESFLGLVYPGDDAKQESMRTGKAKPSLLDCEGRVHRAFEAYAAPHYEVNSGFALQFHQIVVNVCADFAQSHRPVSQLETAVKDACAGGIIV